MEASLTNQMDLTGYDYILINTSAGKDSLAMMDVVYEMAAAQGVTHKLVAVHCDLGRMEWSGTRELAEEQAKRYGIALHVVSRPQGDLLTHVEQRGMWPDSQSRYCTSDHKRGQVLKAITKLVSAFVRENLADVPAKQRRRVRVLNCMGIRAQESTKRAKLQPFVENGRGSNKTVRMVSDWLPIFDWTETQVWDLIHSKSLPYHYAYDLGMPRLSCVFCVFAPKEALLLAGYHNRALLRDYVAVEQKIGHTFQHKKPLVQIENALNLGYVPAKVDGDLWKQCA
jgi:3'-phosphoadenosine 5'-phosphosulfate sulfotransferase (PAPS reductase)/FAD synthetase